MTTLRSHTENEIIDAIQNGKSIYELDTGEDGEDDLLIAAKSATLQDLINEILAYHNLENIPSHWSLTRIDPENIDAYLP